MIPVSGSHLAVRLQLTSTVDRNGRARWRQRVCRSAPAWRHDTRWCAIWLALPCRSGIRLAPSSVSSVATSRAAPRYWEHLFRTTLPSTAEIALHGRFHQFPDVAQFRRYHAEQAPHASTLAQRESWFEPSRARLYTRPRVPLLREHMHAIRRATSHHGVRVGCYAGTALWFLTEVLGIRPANPCSMASTSASNRYCEWARHETLEEREMRVAGNPPGRTAV